MTRARELANFADDTAGLETLTVSDVTDLSVSASNINSATNQITDSSTDLNVDSNTLVVDKSENKIGIKQTDPSSLLTIGNVNDNNSANTPLGKVGQDPAILINNSSHVNSESQLLFGYNSGSETYAPVAISYKNTSAASKGKGHLLFATRDATTDSVPSERMRITSAGDVGIGTGSNTLTEKLRVDGAAVVTGQLQSHQTSAIALHQTTSAISEMRLYGADASTAGSLRIRGYANDGSPFTEGISLSATGNVGIGTDSPDANSKLDVRGDMVMGDGSNFAALKVHPSYMTDGGGGAVAIMYYPASNRWFLFGGNSQSAKDIWIGNGTNQTLYINSTGQIGAGTNSPSGGLHLYDDRDITNNPNDKGIRLDESAGRWLLSLGQSGISNTSFAIRDVTNTNYPFIIDGQSSAGNRPAIKIDSAGKVLVANSASTYADAEGDDLVVGNTSFTATGVTICASSSGSTGLFFSASSSGTGRYSGAVTYDYGNRHGMGAKSMFFRTNTSIKLVLDTDGHLFPALDNNNDCGTSAKRWRNIYTADLQLSNVDTGGNDIDGTEGSWTLQEGAEDLYVINRQTGKKFKFNLIEV